VRVALEIERVSEGRIPASDLNPDVALVRSFRLEAANDASPSSEAA
jgi:DNA-binding transcriptional regulator YdaS (Cro superfamily)